MWRMEKEEEDEWKDMRRWRRERRGLWYREGIR